MRNKPSHYLLVPEMCGSVLVRIYPRTTAASDEIKQLGCRLSKWLESGLRGDGFGDVVVDDFNREEMAALTSGELPLPDTLRWVKAFRDEDPNAYAEPELREFVVVMRSHSASDLIKVDPTLARPVVPIRILGVEDKYLNLLKSLTAFIHAPAVTKVEMRFDDGVVDRGYVTIKVTDGGSSPPGGKRERKPKER